MKRRDDFIIRKISRDVYINQISQIQVLIIIRLFYECI
jgi:hypothetical protein